MTEKIKVLVLADHPLSPSGVGTQTKYFIDSLLGTGKFRFVCLGGAIKHQDYKPVRTDEWGDDFVIYPVDGYGNQEMIRSLLRTERPDILWFMTDPRFFGWLWEIENEVRPLVPMVYYHVWDNYPYPKFNKGYYDSTDVVACISKVTHSILENVAPDVESHYIPHAVNPNIFTTLPEEEVKVERKNYFGAHADKVLFFWNNRNARRKQSGSLIWWFKEFLDEVGHDKAALIMHTNPKDPHGQDLHAIIHELGLTNGEVMFSTQKLPASGLAKIYNMVDCTVNISDAEGFGLATLESLSCGTPIIVNMTGGLQEQVTDGKDWFGVGIKPASKAVIGSQHIPYIYEDRLSNKDVVEALKQIYNMTNEQRKQMGKLGKQHVVKNYSFEKFSKQWIDLMLSVYEKNGSWENRKNYKSWNLAEVI